MILQMPLAKGLSRKKTRQETKRRVVSAFLIIFFMGVALEAQSVGMMWCVVGLGENGYKNDAKYEVKTRDRETSVSIVNRREGQGLAGYRATPDISSPQGRYQLSAILDGVEFTQNDLRDISVDEAGDTGSGEQTAVFIGMPIIQYQSSSSPSPYPSSYLLPIFAPGDTTLPENSSGQASRGGNLLNVRMLAYHPDRLERQWVQASISFIRRDRGSLFMSLIVNDQSVGIFGAGRNSPGSTVHINLYGTEIDNTNRIAQNFYEHLLASWFIQAVRMRDPSLRVTSSGQPVYAPITPGEPSFSGLPTSEAHLLPPSAVGALSSLSSR